MGPSFWPEIGEIGSLVGGLSGLGAVFFAWKTVRLTMDRRRLEHQYEYYRSLVFNPTSSALSQFRDQCRSVEQDAVHTVASLRGEDEGSQVVTSSVREHTKSLFRAWETLNDTLMAGLRAWNDENLTTAIRGQLEQLQDELILAMQELPELEDPRDSDFGEVLRSGESAILGEMMAKDPGIVTHERTGAISSVSKKGFWEFFQQFLVRATAGALFFALAAGLSQDLPRNTLGEIARTNVEYTSEVFIRYGFVLWFVMYLFFSAASNEVVSNGGNAKNSIFDLIQVTIIMIAVGFLGFLLSVESVSYAVTGVTVLILGSLSCVMFWEESDFRVPRIVAAVCGASVVVIAIAETLAVHLLWLPLVVLWFLVLLPFGYRVYSNGT